VVDNFLKDAWLALQNNEESKARSTLLRQRSVLNGKYAKKRNRKALAEETEEVQKEDNGGVNFEIESRSSILQQQ
jgi:hypothetical protein